MTALGFDGRMPAPGGAGPGFPLQSLVPPLPGGTKGFPLQSLARVNPEFALQTPGPKSRLTPGVFTVEATLIPGTRVRGAVCGASPPGPASGGTTIPGVAEASQRHLEERS